MTRYLIKVTYTEGKHSGESHFLRKGGYVTDLPDIQWNDTTYKTEAIAARVCRHMYEENELSRKIERQDERVRIARGGKPKEWYIYESCNYEPFAVEVVGG